MEKPSTRTNRVSLYFIFCFRSVISNLFLLFSASLSLSRLADTPHNEWQYAFQLPSDLLMLIRTYPNSLYEVYEDKLYSNNATVDIDYVFRPKSAAFPAYFVKALGYKLASEFSISITNNQTMADRMEDRYLKAIAKAKFNDSQGRPNVAVQSRPWIEARQ